MTSLFRQDRSCHAGYWFQKSHIADHLNRHVSTIRREVHRNSGLNGYNPKLAQRKSDFRRKTAAKHKRMTPEMIKCNEVLSVPTDQCCAPCL